jgi:hypothetical protein
VSDNDGLIQVDGARAPTELPEPPERSEDTGLHDSREAVSTMPDGFIAIIESLPSYESVSVKACNRRFPFKFKHFRSRVNYKDVISLQI